MFVFRGPNSGNNTQADKGDTSITVASDGSGRSTELANRDGALSTSAQPIDPNGKLVDIFSRLLTSTSVTNAETMIAEAGKLAKKRYPHTALALVVDKWRVFQALAVAYLQQQQRTSVSNQVPLDQYLQYSFNNNDDYLSSGNTVRLLLIEAIGLISKASSKKAVMRTFYVSCYDRSTSDQKDQFIGLLKALEPVEAISLLCQRTSNRFRYRWFAGSHLQGAIRRLTAESRKAAGSQEGVQGDFVAGLRERVELTHSTDFSRDEESLMGDSSSFDGGAGGGSGFSDEGHQRQGDDLLLRSGFLHSDAYRSLRLVQKTGWTQDQKNEAYKAILTNKTNTWTGSHTLCEYLLSDLNVKLASPNLAQGALDY